MSIPENGKRKGVFITLIEAGEPMTPSEIGEAIGETRQAVKYHLDELVNSGIVVNEGESYLCQPVFTDEEFRSMFATALSDLAPAVNERIVGGQYLSPEERTAVVFNCIRMFFALELLEPAVDGDDRPDAGW